MPTTKATTTTKPAATKPATDANRCRGGEGRYLTPRTMKACTNPKHPGRQLCDTCEALYRAAKKAQKPAARKPASAPQTSQKALKPASAKVVPLAKRPTPPAPERKAHPRTPAGIAALVAPSTEEAKA
jgi:hypothetical protein